MIQQAVFYFFASVVVLSSTLMILSKDSVRCALFLVLAFIASSGLWLLTGAEFLALILILVYVGAVMTLFLFVIMMLGSEQVLLKKKLGQYFFVMLVLIGVLCYGMFLGMEHNLLLGKNILNHEMVDNTRALGAVLYTQHGFAFVVAGVLLLAAIIASISLVHRPPRVSRAQDPRLQMQVRKEERIRMVDLKDD